MKIELYTCDRGLDLYKKGMNFGAWKETAESFKDTSVNIKILVDENDIRPCDDGYNITNIKSVEIIGIDFIQKGNDSMNEWLKKFEGKTIKEIKADGFRMEIKFEDTKDTLFVEGEHEHVGIDVSMHKE